MKEYDYCKLYLESSISFDGIKGEIAMIFNSAVEGRTIESQSMLIDCFVNKANVGDGEGFLNWPYYLEVEALEGVEGKEFVRNIQGLINALKARSMRVEASCDFEDELDV